MGALAERVQYGCTVCGLALKPSEAWVIVLPNEDRRYRCGKHRDNGKPVPQ